MGKRPERQARTSFRRVHAWVLLCALAWMACDAGKDSRAALRGPRAAGGLPLVAVPQPPAPQRASAATGTVLASAAGGARELQPAPAHGALGPEQLYLQAAQLLAGERASDAIGLLEHCIVIDAAFAKCYRALGLAYSERGIEDIAVAYYEKYLTLAPGAVDAPVVRHLIQSVLQSSHGVREASE